MISHFKTIKMNAVRITTQISKRAFIRYTAIKVVLILPLS